MIARLLVAMVALGCTTGADALHPLDAAGSDPGGDAGTDAGSDAGSDSALDAPTPSAPDAGVRECRDGEAMWDVHTTGAVTYAADDAMATTPRAVDLEGPVTAIDSAAGSFALTSASGAVTVFMAPLPATGLRILHVGDAVSVHLERGAVVRAADDDALLFAVVATVTTTEAGASFEIAPIFIGTGEALCLSPRSETNGTPPGCWYTTTRTRIAFAWNRSVASLAPGELHGVLTDDGDPARYDVAVVRSARPSTAAEAEAEAAYENFQPGTLCETGEPQLDVVTIGRQPGA